MISLGLVCLAAMFNSIMDLCSHKFTKSVFAIEKDFKFLFVKINKHKWWRWWNADYSWRNKYIDDDVDKGRRMINMFGLFEFKYPVHITDAWHFFKTLMLFSLIGSVVMFDINDWVADEASNPELLHYLASWILFGVMWILSFNVSYNTLFRKNEKQIVKRF